MKCSGCGKDIVAKDGETFSVVMEGHETTDAYCPRCLGPTKEDPINSPPHYIFGPYEVRAVLQAWADEVDITKSESNDWFSMQQYLFRYCRKGKPLRDLKKARKYLDWIIERYDD